MNSSTNRDELFAKGPIPRAVAYMAIPSMITMLVSVVYNLADTFFIGQTGDPSQVAAVSLCMPIFSIFMALGSMFGMGGNSNISRSMGAGRMDRIKNISAFCFYSVIGVGVVLAILMFAFLEPIMDLIGVTETTHDFCKTYLSFITLGGPFIMLTNCCANLVRGEGASTSSMIGNLIGTFMNIILDPIFILVLGLGVGGAAVATVLGNICAFIYYILYLTGRIHRKKKTILSIRPKYYQAKDKIATSVLAIGLPTALNNILMSVANVVMNNTIGKYGDNPLAAMNVAMRVNMLVVFMQMGLCMGIMPLLGYNYGAGNKDRMKRIQAFTGAVTVALGTALTLFMVFARTPIVHAFIDDPDVVSYGIHYLVAIEISGPLIGVFFLCSSTLQGMGKATYSLILTLIRQVVIYIPAILIIDHFWGLNGLCYAQPISDYSAIIMGVIMVVIAMRRFKPKERGLAKEGSDGQPPVKQASTGQSG